MKMWLLSFLAGTVVGGLKSSDLECQILLDNGFIINLL